MQSANLRPARRALRPKTILNRVGLGTTSLLLLAALSFSQRALAADPPAKGDAAADADKDKDKDKAKPEASTDASASGSAEASAGGSTEASANADASAKDSSPPSAEAPPEKAPPEAGSPDGDTPATLPAPPGDIARLPPEAFPSQPIRGIYGGSLWLTFHGLQWPTSPFQTNTPRTQLGFSGSVWGDTGFQSVTTTDTASQDTKLLVHQARFTLRATPTYTKGNLFVQGQGELVGANSDDKGGPQQPYVMRTDDLWVRVGAWNKWDVQVGRYQAWEIYHMGMGLDLNTLERNGAYNINRSPPPIYGATYLYDRPSGYGNIAAHVYPTRFLRAELLVQTGFAGQANEYGARPAVILDFGMVKVKGAAEYKIVKANTDNSKQDEKYRGGAGAIQFILDPRIELGVNGGYGNTDLVGFDGTKSLTGSVDTWSVGGFANARVIDPIIVGVGANFTRLDDTQVNERNEHGEFSQFQSFAAVQALVLDQLFVKAVFGYAKAEYAPATGTAQPSADTAISARLRLMYLF